MHDSRYINLKNEKKMQKQKLDQRLHGNLKPLFSLLLMFFAKICSFLPSTFILISYCFFTQLYHFFMRSSMIMSNCLQLVLTPKWSTCTISESLSLYQNRYYKHPFLHQEVNFESRHTPFTFELLAPSTADNDTKN